MSFNRSKKRTSDDFTLVMSIALSLSSLNSLASFDGKKSSSLKDLKLKNVLVSCDVSTF